MRDVRAVGVHVARLMLLQRCHHHASTPTKGVIMSAKPLADAVAVCQRRTHALTENLQLSISDIITALLAVGAVLFFALAG